MGLCGQGLQYPLCREHQCLVELGKPSLAEQTVAKVWSEQTQRQGALISCREMVGSQELSSSLSWVLSWEETQKHSLCGTLNPTSADLPLQGEGQEDWLELVDQ